MLGETELQGGGDLVQSVWGGVDGLAKFLGGAGVPSRYTIVNSTRTVQVLDISTGGMPTADRGFGRSRRPRRRSRYPCAHSLSAQCCVGPLPGCLMRKHTSRGLNRGPVGTRRGTHTHFASWSPCSASPRYMPGRAGL